MSLFLVSSQRIIRCCDGCVSDKIGLVKGRKLDMFLLVTSSSAYVYHCVDAQDGNVKPS